MQSLGIEGAWLFNPQVHRDSRGSFQEAFNRDEIAGLLGYQPEVAQVNCSVSRQGVIRGIHYADVPPGQAKYVSCVSGAVLDAVVDLRTGSAGFGNWRTVRLDETDRAAVFLSEGLGHGFMALSESATVMYLCSTSYAPGREHGVYPMDPAIGIPWPVEQVEGEPVLSAKDRAAPTLAEAIQSALLPRYDDCAAYAAALGRRAV